MKYTEEPEILEGIHAVDTGLPAETKIHWEDSLRALKLQFQEVLLLTLDGYTPKEIAEILNESYEAVRKRLQRARKALRDIL